jgi:hypothetical protein
MKTSHVTLGALLFLTVLSGIGRADVLQYDDGEYELFFGCTGQAVRFTMPSEAPAYRVETIIFYAGTWEYGGSVNLTVKIWEDDGNPLMPQVGFYDMGPVILQREITIPYYYDWRACDVSDAAIVFGAGQRFFAGWDSAAMWDYVDTTAPDARSIH